MSAAMVAAGAMFGAIVGSFLATLCVRWPEGRAVIVGRSSCDHCGRTLAAAELIPLVSAAALRGRCRGCGGRIASTHLMVELTAAALGGVALAIQPDLSGAALAVFWLLLLAPAVLDARHYWLPDALTLVLAATGLAVGTLATQVGLVDRLIGGAAGFAVLALLALGYRKLRRREGLGAGDPKLLGAIGLWTGWAALPAILVIASVAGLALAVAQNRLSTDRMPFGTLLAVAAILWSAARAYAERSAF